MFPTTSWTLVLRAAGPDARRSALEDLCATYWQPVYAFVKRQVADPEQAKDLTQAFFTRLLEKHDLQPSRPEDGRFRYYLLASVKHFLSNERDRARAQKRGGSHPLLSLNFADAGDRLSREAIDTLTPEKIFEQHWAMLMLDRALQTLRQEFATAGKTRQFEGLKACLTGNGPEEHYRELGAGLGMSEGAVKTAVRRMRHRFGETLRAQVAQTVADPAEVEDELRYLFSVVSS
jgi:RNA polymerase sigma-70 factor (ECF subfamily)